MTITLIVPIYNKAQFLPRCLESIKNQTVPFDEVIFIDDCSTDDCWEIASSFDFGTQSFGIRNRKNKGVSHCRNQGLWNSRCDHIAFLDADDELDSHACEIMRTYIENNDANIIQFGQTLCYSTGHAIWRSSEQHEWRIPNLPKHWQIVWNKIYKTEFLRKNDIWFNEKMRFGEDEIFNVDCLIANGGELWNEPHKLIKHHLDDLKSVCRGGTLNENDTKRLDNELMKRADGKWQSWLEGRVAELHGSKIYYQIGINQKGEGKCDLVYLLRDGDNEELRYSLRSVDENFAHRKVWFVGGQPNGLKPDERMEIEQEGADKFERVRNMLLQVCQNDNISEDFWLMNDDFFIMRPTGDNSPQWHNETIENRIRQIEDKENGGMPTIYSLKLRHLAQTLKTEGLPTLNYAVHKPMLVNRKKALEVLEKFPNEPMFRALYGNYWRIKSQNAPDCKIRRNDRGIRPGNQFISTSDESFHEGAIGMALRERFKRPSRFEV